MFLERKPEPDYGEQQPTFMAIAQNTGLAPNGDPIPGNELPDILMDYGDFIRGTSGLKQHETSSIVNLDDRLDAESYLMISDLVEYDLNTATVYFLERVKESEVAVVEISKFPELIKEIETTKFKVKDLLEEVKIRERPDPKKSYCLVGVRWWGNGVFVREEKLGSDIRSPALYKIRSGWVIYNRLFAYRASFAIVGEEEHGCYVSNEFPTFETKEDVREPELVKKFIVHLMNSPHYTAMIDAQSTGSTQQSRNRFNQKQFLQNGNRTS